MVWNNWNGQKVLEPVDERERSVLCLVTPGMVVFRGVVVDVVFLEGTETLPGLNSSGNEATARIEIEGQGLTAGLTAAAQR